MTKSSLFNALKHSGNHVPLALTVICQQSAVTFSFYDSRNKITIISLTCRNLGFIIETHCVFCEVRTEL
jgi:hypothetical protein